MLAGIIPSTFTVDEAHLLMCEASAELGLSLPMYVNPHLRSFLGTQRGARDIAVDVVVAVPGEVAAVVVHGYLSAGRGRLRPSRRRAS